MKYTLRHLEIFLAVARDESISRAAESLSMSQSATSAALQELEHRYGVQLFDRAAKRLKLNAFGRHIRARAETLVQQAQLFERDLMQLDAVGDLRVGASLTIGNYLAVNYLADYLHQFPEAKVSLQVSSTPEVVAQVLNFELDIGLIEADIHHEDLQLTPWRDDQMRVFCAPDHPLVQRQSLGDKDLLGARWILREAESGARQTFDRAMHGLLPELNIVLELRHNEAIKSAVKAGLGVGCLSQIALSEEIEAGTLVALNLRGRSMHRHFYFVTRRDQPASAAVDNWIACCQRSP